MKSENALKRIQLRETMIKTVRIESIDKLRRALSKCYLYKSAC